MIRWTNGLNPCWPFQIKIKFGLMSAPWHVFVNSFFIFLPFFPSYFPSSLLFFIFIFIFSLSFFLGRLLVFKGVEHPFPFSFFLTFQLFIYLFFPQALPFSIKYYNFHTHLPHYIVNYVEEPWRSRLIIKNDATSPFSAIKDVSVNYVMTLWKLRNLNEWPKSYNTKLNCIQNFLHF